MRSERCRSKGLVLKLALLLLALPLVAMGRAAAEVPYIFLVQNSGWMEPFYSDARGQKFDPAVAAFITRSVPASADIVIASFNKDGEIAGRTSPFVVYNGKAEPDAVAAAVARIDLPLRQDRKLANSDYAEALVGALKDIAHTNSAVVFMVTNNKSAPNGKELPEDGNVVERTEAFNALLKDSQHISRIVAWPIHFEAHSPRHTEHGLVIYGIAYGDEASEPLRQISERQEIRQLLRDPPVRLKPLSFDPLELVLTPGKRGNLTWHSEGHGRIAIDGVSSSGDIIDMRGVLTNVHYPYVIESGRLVAHWQPAPGTPIASRMVIKPAEISALPPFASVNDVSLKLAVSKVERPSLFADQRKIPGVLVIELADLKLGLAPDYVAKMRKIFGAGASPRPDVPADLPQQAPKIFIQYKNVNAAQTEVPLTLIVSYFPWPLILIALGGILLLALVLAATRLMLRETAFDVMIDGEVRKIGLRVGQAKEIAGANRTYIVSRGGFGPPVVKPKPVKPA